jgi:hypothetical protein
MRQADQVLDDEQLIHPVYEALRLPAIQVG